MRTLRVTAMTAMTGLVACALWSASPAHAEPSKPPYQPQRGGIVLQVLDAVIARPVLFTLAIGTTGIYLGTLPVTAFTGTAQDSAVVFVELPLRYATDRPLGNFGELRRNQP